MTMRDQSKQQLLTSCETMRLLLGSDSLECSLITTVVCRQIPIQAISVQTILYSVPTYSKVRRTLLTFLILIMLSKQMGFCFRRNRLHQNMGALDVLDSVPGLTAP